MVQYLMKKIAYIIDSAQIGGAESLFMHLLTGMDKSRYDIYVVCPGEGPMKELYAGIARETMFIREKSLADIRAIFKVALFLRRSGVEMVHSVLYTSDLCATFASLFLKRVRRINTIVGLNFDLTEESGFKRLRRWFFSLIYRFIYLFSSSVIAVSDAVKEDLAGRRGIRVRGGTVGTIYCGIPDKTGDSRKVSREELASRYGIPAGAPLVVSIGTLHYVKGHRYLLESIPFVLKKFPDTRFVIMGDGPERQNLERKAGEEGIGTATVFTGCIADDEKDSILSLCDMMVLPSLSEGCPLVILEAMRVSRPVVATGVGGVEELLQDKKTGILVPPRDPGKMADAIITLLSDKGGAKRLGEEGRRVFTERFTVSKMVRSYDELYARILKRDGELPAC